ncbi:hypothetical protein D9M68_863100 [compost metagenome]
MVLVQLRHRMLGVDQRDDRIQQVGLADLFIDEEGLSHGRGVGQPGGLDDHAVEARAAVLATRRQLAEDAHQIAAHGAADAAVVHLDDLLALFLHQQFVVDAGFAELVFDHCNLVAVLLLQDAVQQRGLAAAEEAGEDGDGNEAHG